MKTCVNPKYLDYIHVPSSNYADIFSSEFNFPRNHIIVAPFGINDCYEEFNKLKSPDSFEKETYALAIGRSNRDYDFLIDAWQEINYPLVIISDTYNKNHVNNKYISIKRDIAGEASYPWIANCRLMIIPIDKSEICSGDTVLLTSMACEREIVATYPSTLGEMYIKNGYNGWLIEKDLNVFRKQIKEILHDNNNIVGQNARKDYLENYSRKSLGIRLSNYLAQNM